MVFTLEGGPRRATAQLVTHLSFLPEFEGLFPEPDVLSALRAGQCDEEHPTCHSGVPEVQQTEAPPHCPPLERGITEGPTQPEVLGDKLGG